MYHDKTETPYLWSAVYKTLMANDNPLSIEAKVKYAARHSLGGVMMWTIDLDDDDDKLLKTVQAADICSPSYTQTYVCSPLGKEKRWWTAADNQTEKTGMCGRMAPIVPANGCCGGDNEACHCPNCVDYVRNSDRI